MKELNSLKRAAKKMLANGLAIGAMAIGAGSARTEPSVQEAYVVSPFASVLERSSEDMPERTLELSFANPVENFEANSNHAYSASQIIGRLNDAVGVDAGADKSALARVGLAAVALGANCDIYAASHELGHVREGKSHGPYSSDFELNSHDITDDVVKTFKYEPTEEQFLREGLAGLNQDEFNAYVISKNGNKNLTFDNGIAFLREKFWDALYGRVGAGSKGSDSKRGGFKTAEFNEKGMDEDVNRYIHFLNKKGINLSERDLLAQSLIADVLSAATWDSARAIGNYLVNGERSIKPTRFEAGGVEFTPPLISHYLTTNGSFYNATSTINPDGENPVEVSIGTDADFVGDEKVDRLRTGAKVGGLRFSEGENAVRFSPFAYFNCDKSFGNKGYSAGAEVAVPIGKRLELTGRAGYNRNDIINNDVMDKDDGLDVLVGATVKF